MKTLIFHVKLEQMKVGEADDKVVVENRELESDLQISYNDDQESYFVDSFHCFRHDYGSLSSSILYFSCEFSPILSPSL